MAKKKAEATWLKVRSIDGSECDIPDELKPLYAFMLFQTEAYTLKDIRKTSMDTTLLYPYSDLVGQVPLKESIGDIILNPLTLHDRLNQNRGQYSVLQYCVSKYLESKDPMYFTLYYLTAGDVLLKNLREAPLDDMAKEWVFEQLEIALKVEADLVRDHVLGDNPLRFSDFEELMVTEYHSLLQGMTSYIPEGWSNLNYFLNRPIFSYFKDKYFEGVDTSSWIEGYKEHKPYDSSEELSR